MEYRLPGSIADGQLTNLQAGRAKVDIEGLLVRLGGADTSTLLLDANIDDKGAKNQERFHDSFLNLGETLLFEDPLSVEITVMSKNKQGLNVRISRTKLKVEAQKQKKAKAEEVMKKIKEEENDEVKKAERIKKEYTEKGKKVPKNSAGVEVIGQSEEQIQEIEKVLAENIGEEKA